MRMMSISAGSAPAETIACENVSSEIPASTSVPSLQLQACLRLAAGMLSSSSDSSDEPPPSLQNFQQFSGCVAISSF
jgi:hypothetical protein